MDASSHAPASAPRPFTNGLRARLKVETHDLHRQAERSGIMQMLLRGRADRGTYCALMRNLYEIYAPLENGLQRQCDHPQVQPIFSRALFRVAHLANDLRVLCGEGWSSEMALQPAAVAYRDRLNTLAATRPALLVAHAYVRYLGDLSGGQVLHRLIGEQFLLGEDATRFYQFGAPAEVDLLLAQFRNGLDAVPAAPDEEDAIVDEAQQAFRRHIDLFQQLASAPGHGGS
jgi:heme oxygenase (biliverdin-producing, ferredoxin)